MTGKYGCVKNGSKYSVMTRKEGVGEMTHIHRVKCPNVRVIKFRIN